MKFPRRRWLVATCLAGAALAGSWLDPGSGVREQYERIRLGMAQSEVTSIVGGEPGPSGEGITFSRWPPALAPDLTGREWDCLRREEGKPSGAPVPGVTSQDHCDGGLCLRIWYRDGRVGAKYLYCRVPGWRLAARDWLRRLRGFVGL